MTCNDFIMTAVVLIAACGSVTAATPNRSPSDLAVTPDGRWAITANTTSNTVSLVDLAAGKVTAEIPVGEKPMSVAISGDGNQAVLTNWLSDSLSVLRIAPPKLESIATIPVGNEPRGVTFSPGGELVYIVLSGEDAVVAVNLNLREAVARATVGREPWHVALTPNLSVPTTTLHKMLDEKAAQLIKITDRDEVDQSLYVDVEGLRLYASSRDCLKAFKQVSPEGSQRITLAYLIRSLLSRRYNETGIEPDRIPVKGQASERLGVEGMVRFRLGGHPDGSSSDYGMRVVMSLDDPATTPRR